MDTVDREDHTFNGIMFNIKVPDVLPIDIVRIDSVWVRGMLGPMSVFVTKESCGYEGVFNRVKEWHLVHQKEYDPSPRDLCELKFDVPLILKPEECRGIYVHSARDDDQGLVYDDGRGMSRTCEENGRLEICSDGMAHLNGEPFNNNDMWGWGRGWRPHREFVGRMSYGVRWVLWRPETHKQFPPKFREVVVLILAGANHPESPLYWLPHEMLFFILNQLNWDSFGGVDELMQRQDEDEDDEMADVPHHRMMMGHLMDPRGLRNVIFQRLFEALQGDEDFDDDDEEYEVEEDEDDEDDEDVDAAAASAAPADSD